MKQEVSELYLQQVNTERLVIQLRDAIQTALQDNMQFATAIGTLQMMIREVEDDAISQLKEGI